MDSSLSSGAGLLHKLLLYEMLYDATDRQTFRDFTVSTVQLPLNGQFSRARTCLPLSRRQSVVRSIPRIVLAAFMEPFVFS